MNNCIKKDFFNRRLYKLLEIKKLALKIFYLNSRFSLKIRIYSIFLLNKFSKNSSKVRNHNMCIMTQRKNGVYSYFCLSRLMIKNLGGLGYIPGLRKHSW